MPYQIYYIKTSLSIVSKSGGRGKAGDGGIHGGKEGGEMTPELKGKYQQRSHSCRVKKKKPQKTCPFPWPIKLLPEDFFTLSHELKLVTSSSWFNYIVIHSIFPLLKISIKEEE